MPKRQPTSRHSQSPIQTRVSPSTTHRLDKPLPRPIFTQQWQPSKSGKGQVAEISWNLVVSDSLRALVTPGYPEARPSRCAEPFVVLAPLGSKTPNSTR